MRFSTLVFVLLSSLVALSEAQTNPEQGKWVKRVMVLLGKTCSEAEENPISMTYMRLDVCAPGLGTYSKSLLTGNVITTSFYTDSECKSNSFFPPTTDTIGCSTSSSVTIIDSTANIAGHSSLNSYYFVYSKTGCLLEDLSFVSGSVSSECTSTSQKCDQQTSVQVCSQEEMRSLIPPPIIPTPPITTTETSISIQISSPDPINSSKVVNRTSQATGLDTSKIKVKLTPKAMRKRDDYVYDATISFLTEQGSSAAPAYQAASLIASGDQSILGDGVTVSNPTFTSFSTPNANECNPNNTQSCSNNGTCHVVSNTTAFCNCYSGFHGLQCEGNNTDWNASEVSATSTTFRSNISFVAGSSDVSFSIRIPSTFNRLPLRGEEKSYSTTTFLRFGREESTECDYPNNPNWQLSSEADGNDVYTNSFNYSQLVSCGLARDNSTSNDYVFYNNTLAVSRNYVVVHTPFHLNRRASVNNTFSVLFPKRISVSSNVLMVPNNVSDFASVVDSEYDPVSDEWKFTFVAATTAPYRLSYGGNAIATRGSSPRIDDSIALIELASCDPSVPKYSEECYQQFQIKATGCQELDFVLEVPFDVICRSYGCNLQTSTSYDPSDTRCETGCVPPDTPTFTPSFTIKTNRACPLEKTVPLANLTLTSFSDDTLASNKTVFGVSETLHFGVSFFSTLNVSSDGVTVDSVCIGAQTGPCSDESKVHFESIVLPEGANYNSVPLLAAFSVSGSNITALGSSGEVEVNVDFTVTYGSGFSKRSMRFASERVGGRIRLIPMSNLKQEDHVHEQRPTIVQMIASPSSGSLVQFSSCLFVVGFLILSLF